MTLAHSRNTCVRSLLVVRSNPSFAPMRSMLNVTCPLGVGSLPAKTSVLETTERSLSSQLSFFDPSDTGVLIATIGDLVGPQHNPKSARYPAPFSCVYGISTSIVCAKTAPRRKSGGITKNKPATTVIISRSPMSQKAKHKRYSSLRSLCTL